ncbi:MAG: hypothetical protein CL674_00550 [Bdellovibrionaceae bacterium]|nr:hypothetical protein [Pseudobdellovibrionaceae bacterium]|tara:strand:- start:34141 stop:34323 length:183 start_codon:yes stop_codon:yes gene_type:complete
MNQDAINKMERLIDLTLKTAREQILTSGVSSEVQKLLLMKELLKEQLPNENTDSTTNKTR